MTNTQIKIALYRNYGRFCKIVGRKDYIKAVANYVQFVCDSIAVDSSISRDYVNVDSLCDDFYYCALA